MSDREREIKLLARSPEIIEELARTPTIAGFTLLAPETREQEDVYLDTEDFLLFGAGYSLRYRRRDGLLEATLKEIRSREGRGLLSDRREIEEVLEGEGPPTGAVGEAVAALAGDAKLLPILRLRTRRRARKIVASGSEVAELCLDEVAISRGEDTQPSAHFREVEVEAAGEGTSALSALGEALLASPELEPSLTSKLERGLALLGIREPGRGGLPAEFPAAALAFRLPEELARGELERRLAARFSTAPCSERVETKTFHDSFDWRIHAGGGTYETTGSGSGRVHVWREAEGRVRHRLLHAADPGFAEDLPPGAFREDLAAVLSMRRLLPVVTVEARVRSVALLDGAAHTRLHVRIATGASSAPAEGAVHALEPRVWLSPVGGPGPEWARADRFLREECGLAPVPAGELTHALAPLGREPGDYTSKFRLALDPAMPAADAARAIHRCLLAQMLRNEDGTRRDLDSEFLHDFRVAVRRTRSALTQIRKVFPEPEVERFKEEFRWLGSETGPARDLDVYLLKLEAYGEGLPQDVGADLEPLCGFLERKRKVAHDRVVALLDSERYRCLVEAWRAFLDEAPAVSPAPRDAQLPVGEVASARIWRVYRRMLKRGRKIDDDTPAVALHDMRIRGKDLRYLLEFFRSLYPDRAIGGLLAELKRLQDNLGDFNDARIHGESLKGFAVEMAEAGAVPVRTQLATGRLLERLDARQAQERKRFARRFERFAAPANRSTFERLFASGGTAA